MTKTKKQQINPSISDGQINPPPISDGGGWGGETPTAPALVTPLQRCNAPSPSGVPAAQTNPPPISDGGGRGWEKS